MPLLDRQQAFAYTQEDLKFIMPPMAANGEEPIGSMGNDSPLAVLSNKDKTLYHYFKQLFAQVTNPPIDPIREELVMSLVSFIGPKPNLLGIDEINPPLRLEVSQPVLDFYEMEKIRHIERYTDGKFKSCELDITYPVAWGKEAIEARLASLAAQAEDAVRSGYSIIIISDRKVDREQVAIPALLALSAIHQHLVGKGLRTSHRPGGRDRQRARSAPLRAARRLRRRGGASLPRARDDPLADSSDADEDQGDQELHQGDRQGPEEGDVQDGHLDLHVLHRRADLRGRGPRARRWSTSTSPAPRRNIEGIGLFEVAEEAIRIHREAFDQDDPVLANMLDAGGEYAWRVRGEDHTWTPDAIAKLQHSARANSYATYKEYAALINDQSQRHMTFRGLFEFRFGDASRCRSRKSSRRPRSSSASPPARCRSARSRPRRTPRSRSR